MKSFPEKSDLSVQATAIMPLLIRMLKDESPDNRAKAAEALSFLHSISWFWFTNSLLHFFIIQFSFLHISHSSYLLQSAILDFLNYFFRFRGLVKWVDWLESDSSLVYWNDWRHQLPNQLLDMSQYSDINQIAYGEIHCWEKDEMLNITSCRYALPHII